jgi:hypothetical protein
MASLRSSKKAFPQIGSLVVYQKIDPVASSKTPYLSKRQTCWKGPLEMDMQHFERNRQM